MNCIYLILTVVNMNRCKPQRWLETDQLHLLWMFQLWKKHQCCWFSRPTLCGWLMSIFKTLWIALKVKTDLPIATNAPTLKVLWNEKGLLIVDGFVCWIGVSRKVLFPPVAVSFISRDKQLYWIDENRDLYSHEIGGLEPRKVMI